MKWKNLAVEISTFFITATITEWQPLLALPAARGILLNDFEFYRAKYQGRILGYVIMPEHYHLLLQLQRPEHLHGWLQDFQKHTANELSKWMRNAFHAMDLATYVQHANGRSGMAVWKEQARALGISSERSLRIKLDYIHRNPVTRGLVCEPSEWPWSSWRNYFMGDDSIFRIDRVELP